MSYTSVYHVLRDREQKLRTNAFVRSSLKRSSYLVEKLELQHTLSGHNGCVNTILFSDDGKVAFTGSDDTYCHIYDVETGNLKHKLSTRHTNNIFYIKDLPMSQGSTIVSCAADGRVLLTDLHKNSTVQLYSHRGRAHRLSLIPHSPCSFYSCGEDGKCCFFDIRTIAFPDMDMTRDVSDIIANASTDHVRRPRTGSFSVVDDASITTTTFKNKQGNRAPIYCIHVNPMKHHEVAVAGSSQYVAIYDARRFEEPILYLCPDHLASSSEHVTGIKYNYADTKIVASYNDDDIYTIDTNSHAKFSMISPSSRLSSDIHDPSRQGGYIHRFSGHRNNDTVKQVSFFGSRSDWVVSGSDCGHIFIWSTATGKIAKLLHGDSIGAVNCFDNHPYFPYLASSGLENEAKIWAPIGEHEPIIHPSRIVDDDDVGDKEKLDASWKRYDRISRRNASERRRAGRSSSGGVSSRLMMQILRSYIQEQDGSSSSDDHGGPANPTGDVDQQHRLRTILLQAWASAGLNSDDDEDANAWLENDDDEEQEQEEEDDEDEDHGDEDVDGSDDDGDDDIDEFMDEDERASHDSNPTTASHDDNSAALSDGSENHDHADEVDYLTTDEEVSGDLSSSHTSSHEKED